MQPKIEKNQPTKTTPSFSGYRVSMTDLEEELASRRFFGLVDQLASQVGHRRGWKALVARKLGVHPSYISKIAAGEVKRVGADVIDRATRALSLSPQFFQSEGTDAPPFQDFVVQGRQDLGRADAYRYPPDPSDYDPQWNELAVSAFALLSMMKEGDGRLEVDSLAAKALGNAVLSLNLVTVAREIVKSPPGEEGMLAFELTREISHIFNALRTSRTQREE